MDFILWLWAFFFFFFALSSYAQKELLAILLFENKLRSDQ